MTSGVPQKNNSPTSLWSGAQSQVSQFPQAQSHFQSLTINHEQAAKDYQRSKKDFKMGEKRKNK